MEISIERMVSKEKGELEEEEDLKTSEKIKSQVLKSKKSPRKSILGTFGLTRKNPLVWTRKPKRLKSQNTKIVNSFGESKIDLNGKQFSDDKNIFDDDEILQATSPEVTQHSTFYNLKFKRDGMTPQVSQSRLK